jgi:hypothetical protein
MLGLGLGLFLMPLVSVAVEDHISQAIEHTTQAIDDGKHGRADGLPPRRRDFHRQNKNRGVVVFFVRHSSPSQIGSEIVYSKCPPLIPHRI